MGGRCMQISANTIEKMNNLSEENKKIVISLVDQLSSTPLNVLAKLREQGLKNPMEMDEINSFIEDVRNQKC